jgi:hypothetical protein
MFSGDGEKIETGGLDYRWTLSDSRNGIFLADVRAEIFQLSNRKPKHARLSKWVGIGI